ncbi:cytochrome c Hsc [Blastopirellula marina DSM 3645]|uniref:Cytochrome c Hsc n=2 Tax=Blastopirellula marina TaxID=124 RepID=A4A2A9_9BACT|nr:cytochrome c Hsc [Blastopirellula marina DSM 3645]
MLLLLGAAHLLFAQAPATRQPAMTRSPQPTKAEPPKTYMPIIDKDFNAVFAGDSEKREMFNERQQQLLSARYDLSDNPSDVMMSGKRKKVQQGVRVKLPENLMWQELAQMTPDEVKQANTLPAGFRPLPHSKHSTGGMVFPKNQIETIAKAEHRDLQRFDTDFDLPDHLMPEYPPPMFLTSRPDLGDVSNGEVLTIKNYFRLLDGKVTPVQMEGMRLLLTPFPQQQFNQTNDRKTKEAELGVTCLDCHVNGHTNATFHLNPDTRPQENRFRIDTVSLRGLYNQQIHGSKRSLRSVEDFTQFEQRTAYFDGDHVTAAKKGVHLPDRSDQVSMMAQMQNMFDFPPAPKLGLDGKLIADKATESEMRGQELFFGKAKCGDCHPAPFYLDNQMHDLHLERFYEPEMISGQKNVAAGPIKTFTLRGIKDSPPYLHDGRLLTLDDTVEFFNLVQGSKLTQEEKADLVAFLLCL